MAMTAPRIVDTLLLIERGPRSKLRVTVDEGPNGAKYVSIKRLALTKEGTWAERRGVALQLVDVGAVAAVLQAAAGGSP